MFHRLEQKIGLIHLKTISEFIHQFKKLLKNKVLWSHTLSRVCKLYVIVGVLIQQPRFLEAHYHLSASMASLITGEFNQYCILMN